MFHDCTSVQRRWSRSSVRMLSALAPLLLAAVLMLPAAAQAAQPRWFINGVLAKAAHQPWFARGQITLKNVTFHTVTCSAYFSGTAWNEQKEAVNTGFVEVTGFYASECRAAAPCEVANERGVKKEGISVTAEGPPTLVGPPHVATEKAAHSGNTSLPWTGELIEKEVKRFVLTHHMTIWFDVPIPKAKGGPGEGLGCELLGGQEIALEEKEGTTEKAQGYELAPQILNGAKNGLNPSHLVIAGERGCIHACTEKGEAPETGRLVSPVGFGDAFVAGEFSGPSGPAAYQLVTAE